MKMWNKLFALFLLWNLQSLVSGKMDAETMYQDLSRMIGDLSFDSRLNERTMDERIKTVEANVNQLMSAIQQCTENSKSAVPGQEAVEDLKESIDFQTLALWKTMTKEKTLLRESVKQLNKIFYEMREHMQKQMSDFFETVKKELLVANISIQTTSAEIKTTIEQFSSTLISESEDFRRGLEEVKRDLKAKGEVMSDCLDLRKAGNTNSGVYTIRLWKSKKTVDVYCDMDTDGGGWTVFQNRFNGSVDFYRSFVEYEGGFGRLDGEFWLGLSYVQELTDQVNGASELRLDVSAADGDAAYEVFQNFYLSGGNKYTLNIDPVVGTAGSYLGLSSNRGDSFSTYDRDVDSHIQGNCAVDEHGGWWYHYYCTAVNLNGRYATPGQHIGPSGMYFLNFKGYQSLKTSKMMFRRTS